jgi:hypothetical protein
MGMGLLFTAQGALGGHEISRHIVRNHFLSNGDFGLSYRSSSSGDLACAVKVSNRINTSTRTAEEKSCSTKQLGLRTQVCFAGVEIHGHRNMLMGDHPFAADLAVAIRHPHRQVHL